MTLFQTQKQLNKASAFFSSTYSFSATVLHTSSFFCVLFLPPLFYTLSSSSAGTCTTSCSDFLPPALQIPSAFTALAGSPLLFSFLPASTLLSFPAPQPCPLFLHRPRTHPHPPRVPVRLHGIPLHCLHQDSGHCRRQVCISHAICFPALSFCLAPAVIINNPGFSFWPSLCLRADVSSSQLAALPGSEPLVSRAMEELDQSRHR